MSEWFLHLLVDVDLQKHVNNYNAKTDDESIHVAMIKPGSHVMQLNFFAFVFVIDLQTLRDRVKEGD